MKLKFNEMRTNASQNIYCRFQTNPEEKTNNTESLERSNVQFFLNVFYFCSKFIIFFLYIMIIF